MPYKFILIIACIALSFIHANGQDKLIDSLEQLVITLPSDTTKVWLLNNIVSNVRERDNLKALKYAEQAEQLAELLVYDKGLALARENKGWILYRKGDFSKSLEFSMKALKSYELLQDRAGVARCLINVAAIHFEQRQYELAIKNFREAYRVSVILGDEKIMARSVNNIGYAFINLNKPDSARKYSTQALKIGYHLNDPYIIAFAHRVISDIDVQEHNYYAALQHLDSTLLIASENNITFLKVASLHRIGKVYKMLKNYDKALSYLNIAVPLAQTNGYKEELERTYRLLAEIYNEKKNIAKAFEYQSAYLAIHDSLYNERLNQQVALVEGRYNSEIKQAQIDLLIKDAQLKSEEIQHQRFWLYFYVGCTIIFIIVVAALLYINQQSRIAKQNVEEKNQAINYQAEQLKRINATKDKLFSIISHDLRSPLANLKGLMDLVGTPGISQDEFINITTVLRRNLDTVHADLDNLLLWAQTQLKGLLAKPESFNLRNLADEKIALFNDPASHKNITIENLVPDDVNVYADRNHISIVLRNLLANAIKFNPVGGKIIISTCENGVFQEISVADTGVGMSSEEIKKLFNSETHFTKPGTSHEKGVGIGLLLTKEFIESNQGSIKVKSEQGKGTTFTFTLKTSVAPVIA